MTNWILIGIVAIIGIFFILPMLGGFNKDGSSNGGIGGGASSNPSGDIGQGATPDGYGSNINYVPNTGTNESLQPEKAPINFGSYEQGYLLSGTGSGKVTYISEDLLKGLGLTGADLKAKGYEKSNYYGGYAAENTAAASAIRSSNQAVNTILNSSAQAKAQQPASGALLTFNALGNGKSTTQVVAATPVYRGSAGGNTTQAKSSSGSGGSGSIATSKTSGKSSVGFRRS